MAIPTHWSVKGGLQAKPRGLFAKNYKKVRKRQTKHLQSTEAASFP
jgi:hypothetical protein